MGQPSHKQRDRDFVRRYLDLEERGNGLPELGTREPGKVDHLILSEWLYRGSVQPPPPQGIGYVAERLWEREQLLDGWSEWIDASIALGGHDGDSLYQIHVNDEIRRARAALGLMPDLHAFLDGGSSNAMPDSGQPGHPGGKAWDGYGLNVNAATGGSAKSMDITRPMQVSAHPRQSGSPPGVTIPDCNTGEDPTFADANLDDTSVQIREIGGVFYLVWINNNALTTQHRTAPAFPPDCYPFNNTSWITLGDARHDWALPWPWLPSVSDGPGPFVGAYDPGQPISFPDWGWPLTISALLGNTDPFAPIPEQLGALMPWTSCKDGPSPLAQSRSVNAPAPPDYEDILALIEAGFLDDYPALLDFYFGNVGIAASGAPSYEADWLKINLSGIWSGAAEIMVRFGWAYLRGTVSRGSGGGGSGLFAVITLDPAKSTSNQHIFDRWGRIEPALWPSNHGGEDRIAVRRTNADEMASVSIRHNKQSGRDEIWLDSSVGTGTQTLVLDGVKWPTAADTPSS